MIEARFQLVALLFLNLILSVPAEQPGPAAPSPFPEIIQLEYGKIISFKQENIQRFLTMNPQIAEAFLDNNQMKIKAVNVGECSILVWTSETRYRLAIIVIPPAKQKSVQQERLENKELEAYSVNFFVDHSYFKNMEGESFSNQSSSYYEQQSNMSLSSRFIKDSKLFLSGNYADPSDDSLELNSYLITISEITWPGNQKYQVNAGHINDNTDSMFSNINTFRGFSILPLKFGEENPLTLSLFYGKEINNHDSYLYSRSFYFDETDNTTYDNFPEDQNETPTFYKLALSSKDPYAFYDGQLKWNLYYTQAKTDSLYHFFEAQIIYTSKAFSINYSLGTTENSISHNLSYFQKFDYFDLLFYKYYSPDMITPNNLNNHDKKDQNTLTFRKNSTEKIGPLTGYNTHFKIDNISQKQEDYTNEIRWNYEWSFLSKIHDLPFSLTLSYDDLDYDENRQTIKALYSSITKNLNFFKPIMLTFSYRKSENQREFNRTYSYNTDTYGFYLNTRLFKNLTYSIQSNTSSNNSNDESQKSTTNNYGHSLSCSHSALNNTLYTTLNISQSIMEMDNQNNLEKTDQTKTTSVSLSLNKIISTNSLFRTSFTTLINDRDDSREVLHNKYSSRFETYFSTKFSTLFGWKPKTLVSARVFMDIDLDGLFTEGIDTGLPEAEILINDKPAGKTDKQGFFNAGEIRGFKTKVEVNKKTIPEGYSFSTNSDYVFKEYKNSEKSCSFGLILNTEVSGVIYNDINLNDIYDDEDQPLNNIRVTLSNGKSCLTNFQGRYIFTPVQPGNYELSIDIFSIPINYTSIENIKKNITIEKGTYQTENFGFQAKRILKGTLYTMNANGFKQPLANTELLLNGTLDTTNSKGIFKFKNIPSGTQTLFIKKTDPSWKALSIIPTQSYIKNKNEYQVSLNFTPQPEIKELEIILK